MKKHLLCIAALTAVGAASAQSSVTLYGTVALGVVKTSGNGALIDAGNGANILGFRGSEDLGSGLRANFDVQLRYSPESGFNDGSSSGRPLFQGQTLVGLSGPFGAVTLGRGKTPLQSIIDTGTPFTSIYQGSQDLVGGGYASDPRTATAARGGTGLGDDAGAARTDFVGYSTPKLYGFTGRLGYGPKNSAADGNLTPDALNTKNLTSVALTYGEGPVYAAVGYERNRYGDKALALAGTYDFKVVKAWLQHGTNDRLALTGPKRKTTTAALTAPFGPFTAQLGYAWIKAEGTAAKSNKISAGGNYSLSKRTFLYATYGETKVKLTGVKTKGADVGVSHSF